MPLKYFAYYLVFLLVDASVSIMAYIFEHERLWGASLDNSTTFLLSLDYVLRAF